MAGQHGERVKGRRFNREIPEFGERAMYLKPASAGRDKLDSRWEAGHFLVLKDESAELIIGTTVGVLKVRSVRSFTDFGDRWKASSLKSVVGPPWCPIPGRDGTEIKSHARMMSECGDGLQHPDEIAPRLHKVRAVKFPQGRYCQARCDFRLLRLYYCESQCSSRQPFGCLSCSH